MNEQEGTRRLAEFLGWEDARTQPCQEQPCRGACQGMSDCVLHQHEPIYLECIEFNPFTNHSHAAMVLKEFKKIAGGIQCGEPSKYQLFYRGVSAIAEEAGEDGYTICPLFVLTLPPATLMRLVLETLGDNPIDGEPP